MKIAPQSIALSGQSQSKSSLSKTTHKLMFAPKDLIQSSKQQKQQLKQEKQILQELISSDLPPSSNSKIKSRYAVSRTDQIKTDKSKSKLESSTQDLRNILKIQSQSFDDLASIYQLEHQAGFVNPSIEGSSKMVRGSNYNINQNPLLRLKQSVLLRSGESKSKNQKQLSVLSQTQGTDQVGQGRDNSGNAQSKSRSKGSRTQSKSRKSKGRNLEKIIKKSLNQHKQEKDRQIKEMIDLREKIQTRKEKLQIQNQDVRAKNRSKSTSSRNQIHSFKTFNRDIQRVTPIRQTQTKREEIYQPGMKWDQRIDRSIEELRSQTMNYNPVPIPLHSPIIQSIVRKTSNEKESAASAKSRSLSGGLYNMMGGDQRGNQRLKHSAHAGGKKESNNSERYLNTLSNGHQSQNYNLQQSQYMVSNNQGEEHDYNFREDDISNQFQYDEIRELVSQEESKTTSDKKYFFDASKKQALNLLKAGTLSKLGIRVSNIKEKKIKSKCDQSSLDDHKNGLDFLEVKREIRNELKEIDRFYEKVYGLKYLKAKKNSLQISKDLLETNDPPADNFKNRTMFIKDSSVQNLRLVPSQMSILVPQNNSKQQNFGDIERTRQGLVSKSNSPLVNGRIEMTAGGMSKSRGLLKSQPKIKQKTRQSQSMGRLRIAGVVNSYNRKTQEGFSRNNEGTSKTHEISRNGKSQRIIATSDRLQKRISFHHLARGDRESQVYFGDKPVQFKRMIRPKSSFNPKAQSNSKLGEKSTGKQIGRRVPANSAVREKSIDKSMVSRNQSFKESQNRRKINNFKHSLTKSSGLLRCKPQTQSKPVQSIQDLIAKQMKQQKNGRRKKYLTLKQQQKQCGSETDQMKGYTIQQAISFLEREVDRLLKEAQNQEGQNGSRSKRRRSCTKSKSSSKSRSGKDRKGLLVKIDQTETEIQRQRSQKVNQMDISMERGEIKEVVQTISQERDERRQNQIERYSQERWVEGKKTEEIKCIHPSNKTSQSQLYHISSQSNVPSHYHIPIQNPFSARKQSSGTKPVVPSINKFDMLLSQQTSPSQIRPDLSNRFKDQIEDQNQLEIEFDQMFKNRFKGLLIDQKHKIDPSPIDSFRSVSSGIFHQIQEQINSGGVYNQDNRRILQKLLRAESQQMDLRQRESIDQNEVIDLNQISLGLDLNIGQKEPRKELRSPASSNFKDDQPRRSSGIRTLSNNYNSECAESNLPGSMLFSQTCKINNDNQGEMELIVSKQSDNEDPPSLSFRDNPLSSDNIPDLGMDGPRTLVSNLNHITQEQSPRTEKEDSGLKEQVPPSITDHNNQKAESLLKYLESKFNEKRLENSSQMDQSRASQPSGQFLQRKDSVFSRPSSHNSEKKEQSQSRQKELELVEKNMEIEQTNQTSLEQIQLIFSDLEEKTEEVQVEKEEETDILKITTDLKIEESEREDEKLGEMNIKSNLTTLNLETEEESTIQDPIQIQQNLSLFQDSKLEDSKVLSHFRKKQKLIQKIDSEFPNQEVDKQEEMKEDEKEEKNVEQIEEGGSKSERVVDKILSLSNLNSTIRIQDVLNIPHNNTPSPPPPPPQIDTTPSQTAASIIEYLIGKSVDVVDRKYMMIRQREAMKDLLPSFPSSPPYHKGIRRSVNIIDPSKFVASLSKTDQNRTALQLKEQESVTSTKVSNLEIYKYLEQSINQSELKSQIRQVLEMMQRQNIESDMIQANDYSNELLAYLLQFEILNNPEDYDPNIIQDLQQQVNYLLIFLKNLTTPIKRDFAAEIHQMMSEKEPRWQHFESCRNPLKHPILPIDLYLDIERQREFEYQMANKLNKDKLPVKEKAYNSVNSIITSLTGKSVSITQECQHIFNKCIFDALNESLTKFRPYNVIGEPYPWSNKYRRLQTNVDIHSVDTERLFMMVKQETFRWMTSQQGALSHPSDSVFQYIDLIIPLMPEIEHKIIKIQRKQFKLKNQQQVKAITKNEETKEEEQKTTEGINLKKEEEEDSQDGSDPIEDLKQQQDKQIKIFKKNLVEQATNELRNKKITSQLNHDLAEDELLWLNYEFEETQIKFDLAELVLSKLVEETVETLQLIQRNKCQE